MSAWPRLPNGATFGRLETDMDQLLAQMFGVSEAEMAKWMNPGRYVGGPELVAIGLAEMVELKTLAPFGMNGAARTGKRIAAAPWTGASPSTFAVVPLGAAASEGTATVVPWLQALRASVAEVRPQEETRARRRLCDRARRRAILLRRRATQLERGAGRHAAFLGEAARSSLRQEDVIVGGRSGGKSQLELAQNLGELESAAIDEPVGGFQFGDLGRREGRPPEADQVQPDDATADAVNGDKRWNVLHHASVTAEHGQPADPAKLVDAHSARDERPIFNRGRVRPAARYWQK